MPSVPPPFTRWLALTVISLAMFGNYYVFDALNPVGPLLERDLGFTQAQIGLLDSSYNIAALLVLLVGGVIIDRAGTRRSLVLFGIITALGGLVIGLSTNVRGMMIGRFVLGVGAEPLIVAITTALAKWFKSKELSFALGVNLMIGRFGSVAADYSRSWAGGLFTSWQPPLLLAAAIGSICIIASLAYWLIEGRAERRYALGTAGSVDKLVLRDLWRFGTTFWLVVGLCVTFYSVVFPFRRFANILLIDMHGVSPEQAGQLNGLLPLTSMFATPLMGLLADRIGRRALLMAIGTAVLWPTFLLLSYTTIPVGVAIAMIGVSFSLIPAVMWPSVAYLVDESRLGTAYSLMTLCQQIAWAIVAWAVGQLNDMAGASAQNPAGYAPGLWVFSILSLFGLLFAWLLRRHETGPHAMGLETIRTSSPT
jgi:MFS family permease